MHLLEMCVSAAVMNRTARRSTLPSELVTRSPVRGMIPSGFSHLQVLGAQ